MYTSTCALFGITCMCIYPYINEFTCELTYSKYSCNRNTHTHTYIYIYTYGTYIHTYIHACIRYTYMHAYIHTLHTYVYIYTYIRLHQLVVAILPQDKAHLLVLVLFVPCEYMYTCMYCTYICQHRARLICWSQCSSYLVRICMHMCIV